MPDRKYNYTTIGGSMAHFHYRRSVNIGCTHDTVYYCAECELVLCTECKGEWRDVPPLRGRETILTSPWPRDFTTTTWCNRRCYEEGS